VALKLWHRPVSEKTYSGSPPSMDTLTFMTEVSLLLAIARESSMLYQHKAHGLADVDGGVQGLRGFIVTELLPGVNMQQRFHSDDPVTMPLVRKWAKQLAALLAELHRIGVIHRDVKASNVMVLDATNDLNLIDFGLSLRSSGGPLEGKLTTHQSSLGVGVLGYMAPEVFRGDPYGTPVDVFAYGVLLSKMLRQAQPLDTRESLLRWLLCAPFELLPCAQQWSYAVFCQQCSVVPRRSPAELSSLVRWCCEHDAARRPRMADAVEHLKNV